MFRKLSRLRRRHHDESRLLQNPDSTPSSISGPHQEDQVKSSTAYHSLSSAIATNSVQFQREYEAEAGPLGLTVVYTPENAPKADVVFVHGLGGTSRWTWSKNKDPELFWPSKFLPLEPDVCQARILTFGYNADFRVAGSVSTSILDFAKDLLYDLKYAKDDRKQGLNMGSVPLIFVVHSMGGLVVKETYIQGQNDPEYESIIKSISSIIFLSTPHRGTHLAETLNRILQSTMIISSKQYISELVKNSLTLQRLNEQFRHVAPRLDIISFYETRATSIMVKSVMVLEKDSSVLGYPGEISRALDADHHGVCKYDSPRDPNYIAVRNALMSLLEKVQSTRNLNEPSLSSSKVSHDLKSLLAITELPAVDYSYFRDQWAHGTCEWILKDTKFLEWFRAPEPVSRLLWLSGGPATGKSVLSSFIINELVEREVYCQYFFIRFGDQKKRTPSLLLCSIAYQIAQAVPEFSQKLLELVDEAVDYGTANLAMTWERIFKSILFKLEWRKPLYWIIDGLDEAHDPRRIIKTLSDVSPSSIPLRILLVGRETPEIVSAFQNVPSSLSPKMINVEGHFEDLQCYVRQELILLGNSEFKEDIVNRIVEGSQNNFLWVRLTVSKLNQCHRRDDVELVLQELPNGMEALYDRMALSIAQNRLSSNRALALHILECVTCSFRELTVAELSQVLHEDMLELIDIERSIVDLCGGFVAVDNGGNVTMIHQTAREYLLSGDVHPFHVDPGDAHERLFLSCMKCLMTIGLRSKVNRNQTPEFVDYASIWWSSHLKPTPLDRGQVSQVLKEFLTNHWVLTWIHIVAANNQQQLLIQSSNDLSNYYLEQQHRNTEQRNKHQQIVEQDLLESWPRDFVKLVGKFGTNLRRNPESIYKQIPPFCPRNSSIYRLFGKAEAKNITVSGISTENWDDLAGRIPLGSDNFASSIQAAGTLVGILACAGSVLLYDSLTFEKASASPIVHGERLYRMELNSTATLLATYGYRTIKVWDTSTGVCKVSVDNLESRPRPLTMLFINKNNSLLVGHDDRRIRSLDLSCNSPTWQLVADLDEPELEGHFLNSSSYMTLNRDGTLAAVAYRGHPLSAWEINGPVHLGHCWRTRDQIARGEVIDAVWHPHSPELLGLYIEGVLFKWHPYDGRTVEISIGACRLAISKDGNFLATGDKRGTVRVFNTTSLSLLHQLTAPDVVLGLAFSPENRRFYDIRGDHGNAWELDPLMRFTEQTEKSDENGDGNENLVRDLSTSSSLARRIDAITVLATSPAGRLYSYGTETGTVYLADLYKRRLSVIYASKGFLSIENMSWSNEGRYMCFSDTSKRVFIRLVIMDASSSEPVLESIAEIPTRNITTGPIAQLLFHTDSNFLLVFTHNEVHAISLASLSVTRSVKLDIVEHKWIIHPQDSDLIIGFGPKRVRILDWNLVEIRTYNTIFEGPSDLNRVERILVTRNKMHLLVQLSPRGRHSKEKTFHYFKTSELSVPVGVPLDPGRNGEPLAVTPTVLSKDISSRVALILLLQSHDRLVFLTKDHSICSYQLPSGLGMFTIVPIPRPNDPIATETQSREIFALPVDWTSGDFDSLYFIWEVEKSFLCPRNGEVAIVRCPGLV